MSPAIPVGATTMGIFCSTQARCVRHKTVELIVETLPWRPRARVPRRDPHDMVGVRIEFSETALRERIKSAGGIWRPRQRLWEID